jgi:hypothetical protein
VHDVDLYVTPLLHTPHALQTVFAVGVHDVDLYVTPLLHTPHAPQTVFTAEVHGVELYVTPLLHTPQGPQVGGPVNPELHVAEMHTDEPEPLVCPPVHGVQADDADKEYVLIPHD